MLILTLGSPVAGRPSFVGAITLAILAALASLVGAEGVAAGVPVSSSFIDLPLAIGLPLLLGLRTHLHGDCFCPTPQVEHVATLPLIL